MAADTRSLVESPLLVPAGAAVTIVACAIVGSLFGLPVGLLVVAACALNLVIGLMWQSLQHLSGEAELTLDEAFSLAAPTAEEEQKRAVLRALKDLEYELRVGKISQADYLELSARYREDAKKLILAVDERLAETRARAELLLDERLNPKTQPSPSSDAESEPRKKKKKAAGGAAAKPAPAAERRSPSDAPPPTQSSPISDESGEADAQSAPAAKTTDDQEDDQ